MPPSTTPAGQAVPATGPCLPVLYLEVLPMIELIVLAVILAGLAAMAHTPVPGNSAESATQPVPSPWSVRRGRGGAGRRT